MASELEKFMLQALNMSSTEHSETKIESIRRVRSSPAARTHHEALITFGDPEQRDFVFSRGKFLSEYVQDGKPTAGMRMDIPAGLVDTHKLLNDLGYQIKRRFGANTRKYVKFDTNNDNLYLEVRLPESYNLSLIHI